MASTNHPLFRKDSAAGSLPSKGTDYNEVQSSAKIAVQPVGPGGEYVSPGYESKASRLTPHNQGMGTPTTNP